MLYLIVPLRKSSHHVNQTLIRNSYQNGMSQQFLLRIAVTAVTCHFAVISKTLLGRCLESLVCRNLSIKCSYLNYHID